MDLSVIFTHWCDSHSAMLHIWKDMREIDRFFEASVRTSKGGL